LSNPFSAWTRAGFAAIGMCMLAAPLGAQVSAGQGEERLYMSRAALTDLLNFYDGSAASPAYGDRLRDRARAEAQQVRTRLEDGDFQVGDRLVIQLEGQEALSDTFTVGAGRVVRLPELGEVDLQGKLRSELEPVLLDFVGRFVREPRLLSQSLIRIQFDGAVARPGFYTMPSETPLPDAIMLAGGPTGQVKLDEIRVTRVGRQVLTGEMIQRALAEGRTLDELGLQAGDRVTVPERFPLGSAESAVRTLSLLATLPLTVAALIALF
jgi:hypothetical protein